MPEIMPAERLNSHQLLGIEGAFFDIRHRAVFWHRPRHFAPDISAKYADDFGDDGALRGRMHRPFPDHRRQATLAGPAGVIASGHDASIFEIRRCKTAFGDIDYCASVVRQLPSFRGHHFVRGIMVTAIFSRL